MRAQTRAWTDLLERAIGGLACTAIVVGLTACGEPDSLLRESSKLRNSEGLNVIVVSFDALRPDHLGVHGYERNTSPRIDEFAAGSLVFDRAYSVAPVTPTSFAAAFSGSLPPRSFRAWKLVTDRTLAERFRELGYETVAFIDNVQMTDTRGFDRGFDDYQWFRNQPTEAFYGRVREWLARPHERPFFLWVHFLPPHAPYRFHAAAEHLYDPSYEGPFETRTGVKFTAESEADIERLVSLYDGEIYVVDEVFGRLWDGLVATGLDRSSIVVLTSDHGEELGEHGGFQHGHLYDEHLRIPFMIRHPNLDQGIRTDRIFRNVDLLPTLLGMLGVETEDALDGVDLLAAASPPDAVVGVSMTAANERYVSLREGPLKVLLSCLPEKSVELCEFQAGAPETCIPGEQRASDTRRLLDRLDEEIGGDPCAVVQAAVRGADPTTGLDEETVEGLRALGYLD